LRAGRIASHWIASQWRGLALGCAISLAPVWISFATAEPLLLEIKRAATGLDQRTNKPIVSITLTEASMRAFAEATAAKVGSRMELRVGGQVLSKVVIREPLIAGSFQISGDFSVEVATAIADRLSTPGAKIEAEFVSE
jgi:preprotein translocase subunit SecD